MDILSATVEQHHQVILESVQSETFKKIVATAAAGLELSSDSKLVTLEPDALHNLLVLQFVEHAIPLAEGVIDDEPWDLLSVSPEGVERHDLKPGRLYRCSPVGHAAWRVLVGSVGGREDIATLRQSLEHALAAEWRLHGLLDKMYWKGTESQLHLLRRLEVIWSEFVALIDQDVEAVANAHATAMAPPTRKAMVRLRKALNTVESARLAKPSDAVLDALEWIKQLVANWPLRVVVKTQEANPKKREWTQARAQEWFKDVAHRYGKHLSVADVKRITKEEDGPSCSVLYKPKYSFFRSYMKLSQAEAAKNKHDLPGKRVSLDRADSELASKHGAGDQDELEEAIRDQAADMAEGHRSRPKG